MIKIDENLTVVSPAGFKASGIHCGLKKSLLKKDLALIYSETLANSAGVYTKNKVKGAPLTVTKKHLTNKKSQAIIINSGNANTCTGDDGLAKAIDSEIPEDVQESAKEARDGCPVDAIDID